MDSMIPRPEPMEGMEPARSAPKSYEAEQAVIGSMIMDVDAILAAMEVLLREDFYYPQFSRMYEAIIELYNENIPVDFVTLRDRLRRNGAPEEVAELSAIAAVAEAVPTAANVGEYIKITKDKSLLRQVIDVNKKIEDACYAEKEPVDDIMDRTEQDFLQLLRARGVSDYTPISDVVVNALNRIEAASKQDGDVTGIPTGFIDLDRKTAGLQASDLVLIAARPSMGKTAFVLNIAEYVAFHEDECVAVFSLEMSKEQLVNRLLSLESRVDAQKLRVGDLAESDWEKLLEGAATIGRSNLIIDDTAAISVSNMRSKCRKYKQEHDLKLIIIDYLQLMSSSSGAREESQQQKISDISRSLKALARELDVPVIALSQLNRNVEQREDKRPMLSDLRDSGAIEQDADVVMFIYRDDYYNKDSPIKGVSEIIIAKQRNGPVGTVELAWLPEYTKFANLERRRH